MLRLKRILEKHGWGQNRDARKIGISESLLSGIVNQTINKISTRSHKKITAYLEAIGVDGEAADWHLSEDKGVRMLQQDVLRHWGFGRDPFINEIMDPAEDCYLTDEARWVERNLSDLIDGKGFAALVGPTGAGKSTLVDRIIATKRNLAVAKPRMCDTEKLHAGQIYDAVIHDFAHPEKPKQSRESRARQMEEKLIEKKKAGTNPLLMVEEAHRLHPTTLRAVKAFYDQKLEGRRLLSILLIGQEPLRDKIRRVDMLEVERRCQIFELRGLMRTRTRGPIHVEGKNKDKDLLPPTPNTIRAYLDAKFGKLDPPKTAADVFEDDALAAMATRVKVQLELNCLASAALTEAAAHGSKCVKTGHVNES